MAPPSRLASRFLAVALTLFILISGLTDIVRLRQPIGWFGTVANSDFVITGVAPGTPADLAAIRAGDRFDIHPLPPQERWYLFPQNCLAPGITLTVGVIRDGRERFVTMTSVQEPMGAPQQTALVISQVTGLLFVVIGLFTVLGGRADFRGNAAKQRSVNHLYHAALRNATTLSLRLSRVV